MAGLILTLGHVLVVRMYPQATVDLILDRDKSFMVFTNTISMLSLILLQLAPALLTVPTTLLKGWRRVVCAAAFVACVTCAFAGCASAAGYFLSDFAPRSFWGTDTSRFVGAALANLRRIGVNGLYATSGLAIVALLLVAMQIRARVLVWTAGVGLGLLLFSWLGSALLPRETLRSSWGYVIGTPALLSALAIAFLAWHRGWSALLVRARTLTPGRSPPAGAR
jgi:hypothetical protein